MRRFVIYTVYVARFSYTAEKSDGEVYKGITQARDRFEAYEVIRREGGRLLDIEEDRAGLLSTKFWNERFSTIKEYDGEDRIINEEIADGDDSSG